MGALVERRERRSAILRLQETMQDMPGQLDSKDLPVRHLFAPGVYAREITMPEGVVVIGKIHKHEHVNIISMGRVRVATEFGVEEFAAPYSFVSKPGTKRVVYVLETTVWTTIHPTDETDLAKIEQEVIAERHEDVPLLEV